MDNRDRASTAKEWRPKSTIKSQTTLATSSHEFIRKAYSLDGTSMPLAEKKEINVGPSKPPITIQENSESTGDKESKKELEEVDEKKPENKPSHFFVRSQSAELPNIHQHISRQDFFNIQTKFVGAQKEKYQEFFEYFSHHPLVRNIQSNDHNNHLQSIPDNIGKIDKHDKHFFQPIPYLKKIAASFLNRFWNYANNLEKTIEYHQKRYANFKAKKNIGPVCLSFHLVHINGEKEIIVTLSGSNDSEDAKEIRSLLNDFIEQNNSLGKGIPFRFVDNDPKDFRSLISKSKNLIDQEQTLFGFELCSEAYSSAYFFEKFLQLGRNFWIESSVNADFYPFQAGKKYGDQVEGSEDETVVPPVWGEVLDLRRNDKIFVPIKPCCNACLSRKSTEMIVLHVAQSFGTELQKKAQKTQNLPEPKTLQSNSVFKPTARKSLDQPNNYRNHQHRKNY